MSLFSITLKIRYINKRCTQAPHVYNIFLSPRTHQNIYEKNATEGLVPFIPQDPSDTSRYRVTLANNSMWVGFISFWTFIIIYQVPQCLFFRCV